MKQHGLAMAIAVAVIAPVLGGEEDGPPSEKVTLGIDRRAAYFRIGPAEGVEAPKNGHGLLVILPGGDGSEDFHPFCRRILQHACPGDFIAAQPIAIEWKPGQKVIWPTAGVRTAGMRFTTEQFVDTVIRDVGRWKPVDPKRVFVLAWSSSGPAAYSLTLLGKTRVRGALVAMSVFKPTTLPSLRHARDRRFYILHSPDDRVCPYRMAEEARSRLDEAGARVKLVTYEGGHGWKADPFGTIRKGLAWLEVPPPARADGAGKAGDP